MFLVLCEDIDTNVKTCYSIAPPRCKSGFPCKESRKPQEFKVRVSMFSCSKKENVTLLVSANVFKKTPSMTDFHAYVVTKLLKRLLNLNNMATG